MSCFCFVVVFFGFFFFLHLHQQGASVICAAGKVYVRRTRWWPKRFPRGVFGQSQTGAEQKQRNERKHQEVPGRGQKTGGIRRIETSP